MGDACKSPGSKLEVGLTHLLNLQERGLLGAEDVAKAKEALLKEYTKSLFESGNTSGGGVPNATVGARAAPPVHNDSNVEDQCAAETLSTRFTRPSKSNNASKSAQQTLGAWTRSYQPWTILGEFGNKSAAAAFLKKQEFVTRWKGKVCVNVRTRKGEPTGNVYVCISHVGCKHQIRTRPPTEGDPSWVVESRGAHGKELVQASSNRGIHPSLKEEVDAYCMGNSKPSNTVSKLRFKYSADPTMLALLPSVEQVAHRKKTVTRNLTN